MAAERSGTFRRVATAQPPPGRPRDPAIDHAVRRATRELLGEAGYAGTTIVAVARRAGVGAPAIYRRWPRREALIEDAVFGEDEPPTPMPAPTGDLRADLRAWVGLFLERLADPVTRAAMPGLLLAYQHDAARYARVAGRFEAEARADFGELVRPWLPALSAGSLRDRVDGAFDVLVAGTATRAMTVGAADGAAFADRLADTLTALVLSPWQPQSPSSTKSTR
jgi:AcrR family transcriptional regulator